MKNTQKDFTKDRKPVLPFNITLRVAPHAHIVSPAHPHTNTHIRTPAHMRAHVRYVTKANNAFDTSPLLDIVFLCLCKYSVALPRSSNFHL